LIEFAMHVTTRKEVFNTCTQPLFTRYIFTWSPARHRGRSATDLPTHENL